MSDAGPSAWKIQQAMQIWHERQKQILAEDGEVSDTAKRYTLEAQTGGLATMQTWIVRAIRNAQAMAAAVKQERDDLAVREKRFLARAENLRASLAAIIEISEEPDRDGRRKVVLPIATVSLAPGGRKVEIVDDEKIPDRFYSEVKMVRVRSGFKKDELIQVLTAETIDQETGEILPPPQIEGVTLTNGSPQLTIRGK